MNCNEWLNCTLAPYTRCPYCGHNPCELLVDSIDQIDPYYDAGDDE